MGKITETLITNFNGGMTNEKRLQDTRYATLIKNFDAYTYAKKLVPLRDSESGDSAASTSQKQNFCVAIRTGTTYKIFALGRQSATNKAEILMKTIGTGTDSTDLDDSGWAASANNQAGQATPAYGFFVYYKRTGLIYGAHTGTHIFAFDPTSVATFADTHQVLTYTNIAQGLVHSKDDILYVPYDNYIAKNNNGVWTTQALTLPTHLKATSICEYGNYLAIACAPLSGYGKSVVYLWDRDASLATLSESIDWGEGVLQVLEEVDGYLIGISYISGFVGKIVFKYASGNKAIPFKEIISEAAATSDILPLAKQKISNNLYFLMTATLNGVKQQGLWKLGKKGDSFSLIFDRTPENDTAVGTILNFFIINAAGEYVFFSYTTAAAAYALSKTNDQASYTASSLYESLVFNVGDSSLKKALKGVSVMTEPLPANGSVVLKYKTDEDSSWSDAVFTNTTNDSISYSAVNSLPKDYKEIQFQITSTGGAVITGLSFKEEITNKRAYD